MYQEMTLAIRTMIFILAWIFLFMAYMLLESGAPVYVTIMLGLLGVVAMTYTFDASS